MIRKIYLKIDCWVIHFGNFIKLVTNNNISANRERKKALSPDFVVSTCYTHNEKRASKQNFNQFSVDQNLLPICFQTPNIAQLSNVIKHMKLSTRMFAVNCHAWIRKEKFGQKMCKHGVFSGPYFSVFRPEKTAVTHSSHSYPHSFNVCPSFVNCHLSFIICYVIARATE